MEQIQKMYKALVAAISAAATAHLVDNGVTVSVDNFWALLISAGAVGFLTWVVPNVNKAD